MEKKFFLVCVTFVAVIIFCGAASAATVNKNSVNTVKINNVGSTISQPDGAAVSGSIVVWEQVDSAKHDAIYYKNLATGAHGKVFQSIKNQCHPDICGTRVVWEQETPTSTAIYVKNLATGACGRVMTSSKSQYEPRIDGTRVVWEQDHKLHYDSMYGDWYDHNIYVKNIATGLCVRLSPSSYDQTAPDISGTRVVWIQNDNIHVKNLATGAYGKVFSSSYRQEEPAISGTRIVWTQTTNKGYGTSIYIANLATGKYSKLTNDASYDESEPDISGTRVVWSSVYDDCVYVKNVATGATGKILTSKFSQWSPSISGTRIIWLQDIDHYLSWGIYTLNLATGKYGRVTP